MGFPYRARVSERVFLNLPGFHGGAYVLAYIEDTSERGLVRDNGCDDPECTRCPHNFEPRMILELADCSDRIQLEFDLDSEAGRANSLHKLDTLSRPCASSGTASWTSSSRTTGVSASSTRCATSRAGRASSSTPGASPP